MKPAVIYFNISF